MNTVAPHPREVEIVEYVLGTLPLAERRSFEADIAADKALRAAVQEWQESLTPLAEAVPPVEPSPTLRAALMDAVAATPRDDTVVPFSTTGELDRLRRSRSRWRAAAAAASALAASLAVLVATGLLERGPPPGGLLAVVNRSGELPALVVRVDPKAGLVQVRELAAERPPERALELWSIVAGGAPRSLGVIGPSNRLSVPDADRARLDGATLAVSVEPVGGSPTGRPTGPVVYTGRLVPESP